MKAASSCPVCKVPYRRRGIYLSLLNNLYCFIVNKSKSYELFVSISMFDMFFVVMTYAGCFLIVLIINTNEYFDYAQ